MLGGRLFLEPIQRKLDQPSVFNLTDRQIVQTVSGKKFSLVLWHQTMQGLGWESFKIHAEREWQQCSEEWRGLSSG